MKAARVAIGLWFVLALAVFSVKFDWETRVAAYAFVGQQLTRQQQGRPPITIDDGFRPMVRAAARGSAVWLLAIAALGSAAVIASRRDHHA